jgi:flavin-dependent thymidylate synthase
MAAAAELYDGEIVTDPMQVSRDRAQEWFADMTRTVLKAPLEFIHLHFLFQNVSRAFTHQLVRQRTAAYVQESQRFAIKRDADWAVMMPPSIAALPEDATARKLWESTVQGLGHRYNDLVNHGIPAEDARGLLPTNILTRVHYTTNLRNLIEHAGLRLCTQAQFEWRAVWAGMISEIRDYGNRQDRFGNFSNGEQWEFAAIGELFRPICYRTGKCEFMAQSDRFCKIRPRVQEFHAGGVASDLWDDPQMGDQMIRPEEWLLDPAAARTLDPEWRAQ